MRMYDAFHNLHLIRCVQWAPALRLKVFEFIHQHTRHITPQSLTLATN